MEIPVDEALNLIKKLHDESKNLPEVIAPVLAKKDVVRVFINNHPYKFNIETKEELGWYILQPVSLSRAEIIRPAMPFEIQKCLEQVPKLRLIAMRRVSESRWLAFPFNTSDANGRGIPIQPLEVFLINQNLEPFSIISARIWGNLLLFGSYVYPPDIRFSQQLDAGKTESPEGHGITPEFKTVYSMLTDEIEQAKKKTTEGKIKSAVEYLGAELMGFREFGDGYEVEYRDHGNVFKVRVAGSLRLRSAGICLSGLENQQTLASCVAVMRKNTWQHPHFYDESEHEYSETEDG